MDRAAPSRHATGGGALVSWGFVRGGLGVGDAVLADGELAVADVEFRAALQLDGDVHGVFVLPALAPAMSRPQPAWNRAGA